MQIDFKALEQALAPIEEIGQGELTFEAGSTTITLRVLLPAEEVEAQRHAAEALNEADEGEHSAVDYLDRFRTGCLAHAVVAVGDLDFRGVKFIETGEKLDNGTAVKITKSKALRELLARWTRPTLTRVFGKFSELTTATEAEAEKLIEFEPSNVPAEIDRLQKRMDEMRDQVKQNEALEKAKFSDKVATLAEADGEVPDAEVPAPNDIDDDEPKVDPDQLMPAQQRRTGPISPQTAPPPAKRTGTPPLRTQPPQPHQLAQAPSSFINTDDEDGMDAALDAEHNRIAAMRRRAAAGQTPLDEGSALQTIHPQTQSRRRPPHADARDAEEAIGVLSRPKAQEVGKIDGKPVFDMGSQTLETKASPKPGRVVVNPPSAPDSGNPRFTPRQKP